MGCCWSDRQEGYTPDVADSAPPASASCSETAETAPMLTATDVAAGPPSNVADSVPPESASCSETAETAPLRSATDVAGGPPPKVADSAPPDSAAYSETMETARTATQWPGAVAAGPPPAKSPAAVPAVPEPCLAAVHAACCSVDASAATPVSVEAATPISLLAFAPALVEPWEAEMAFTPQQTNAMAEFRRRAGAAGHYANPFFDNTPTCYRFCKARNYNVDKALAMFAKHLQWREEWGLSEMVDGVPRFLVNFKFPQRWEHKAAYNHSHHKVDRLGRPVFIDCAGKMDYTKVKKLDRNEVHHRRALHKHPALSLSFLYILNISLSISLSLSLSLY